MSSASLGFTSGRNSWVACANLVYPSFEIGWGKHTYMHSVEGIKTQ